METDGDRETIQEIVFGDMEIFNNISKYLTVWDLKACRMVAKQWNENVIVDFQERTKVVWDSLRRFNDFAGMISSLNQKLQLPFPFRDLEVHMEEIPNANKLHIMSWFLGPKSLFTVLGLSFFLGQESSVQWMEHHKSTIKEITILDSEYKIQSGDSVLRDFNFPNLEKITLNLGVAREPGRITPDMCHLMDIISSFLESAPNLRSLSLISNFRYEQDVVIMDSILSELTTSTIKHLNLYFQQPAEMHLELITKLDVLPLKSVSLYLKELENTAEPIFYLIHRTSTTTIQELNLFHSSKPSRSLGVPSCSLITDLQLPTFTIGNAMNFLLQFPSLLCLKVQSARIRQAKLSKPEAVTPFTSLKELHVYGVREAFCTRAAMDWLLRKFPCVETWGFKYKAMLSFSRAYKARKEIGPVPTVREIKVGCWSNMDIFADEHEPGFSAMDMQTENLENKFRPLNLSMLASFNDLTRLHLDDWRYWSIRTIPFHLMPQLKTMYIYWGPKIDVTWLNRKVQGLERVYIMNCCLCKRQMGWKSQGWLEIAQFFNDIPKAACGCATNRSEIFRGFIPEFPEVQVAPVAGPSKKPTTTENNNDSDSELPDI